jgi:hypothetical protein
MERDAFITTGYCLVGEHSAIIRAADGVPHGGVAPALTNEEVIPLESGGASFQCRTDQDL